jgi:hypothetical protein
MYQPSAYINRKFPRVFLATGIMDGTKEMARRSGRAAGKVANALADSAVAEKLQERQSVMVAAVSEKYLERTGHLIQTDLKIAAIAAGVSAVISVASMAPAIAIAGAVGAATCSAASESELAQKAKRAYEEKLGRDLTNDKAAALVQAKAGLKAAASVGIAAINGYQETRR